MRFSSLALALSMTSLPASAEVPAVVTDIAPTQSLVAAVMQGLGQPVQLIGAAADPHHFQLRPGEARSLARADAVFWIGEGLTPWLAGVVAATAGSALSVELSEAPGVTHRPPLFAGDGKDDHGHDHGAEDPHVWLDPANARAMTREIAARLSALDPGNAASYAANADAAIAGIDGAEAAARDILTPYRSERLVVWHDAYAHFAAAFDVTIVAAIADSDAATPGAARLAALRGMIGTEGAACIFDEPQHSGRAVTALAADIGVALGALDPMGAGDGGAPGEVILGLARAIEACLAPH